MGKRRTSERGIPRHGSIEGYQKRPTVRQRPQHIRQMHPASASSEWESDAAYERRQKRVSYVEEGERRRRRKRMTVVAVILVVAVAIALVVGVYVYFKSTDSNLTLADDTVRDSLVAAGEGEPYYVLCTADLRDQRYSYAQEEDLAYMLARVDLPARTITLVTIPSVLKMEFPDGEFRTLADAADAVPDGEVIGALAKFADVDISHFVTTDAREILSMTQLVGGVEVELAQEIDDPRAGVEVIDVGPSTLEGPSALTYLRATNLLGGFEATAAHRASFTMALLGKALDSQGLSFASIVSDASSYLFTDFSTSDLLSLGDALRPFDTMTVYDCVVPYTSTKSIRDGSIVHSCNVSEWQDLMTAVRQGRDPATAGDPTDDVNAGEVTVEVRNGTSINGAAASLANMLSQLGYAVIGTGNVGDGITYPETLVVYTDDAYADAAKAIVRDVGIGRVVNGGDFYSSDAGVIAIIGADWSS